MKNGIKNGCYLHFERELSLNRRDGEAGICGSASSCSGDSAINWDENFSVIMLKSVCYFACHLSYNPSRWLYESSWSFGFPICIKGSALSVIWCGLWCSDKTVQSIGKYFDYVLVGLSVQRACSCCLFSFVFQALQLCCDRAVAPSLHLVKMSLKSSGAIEVLTSILYKFCRKYAQPYFLKEEMPESCLLCLE